MYKKIIVTIFELVSARRNPRWRPFRSFNEIRTINLLKFCVKLPNIKDFCVHLYIQMNEEFIWMIDEFVSAWRNWRWRLFEIFRDIKENLGYVVQDPLVERAKELINGDKTLIATHHSKVDCNKSSINTNDGGSLSR